MKKLAELSKKTFAMLIIVMLVISIIPNTGITEAVATEDYRSWSQADSRWGSLTLGSGPNTMSSSGCLVTSLAKMMIQANIKDTSWTPASMRNWLMSNNLLDYYGSVTSYAAIANISSDLNFIKTIDLQCNWTLDKSTILSLANQNYQIILSVKGGAASGTHFVLVDNKLSVTNNDVYIMDTSKTISYNVGKIASSRYNYANKCVVFYSNQNVAPIVEKTDLGTDFYAAIINTERNKALTVETNNNNNIAMYTYTGAPNQIWHFTKNNDASYRITSCYNGESMDVCGGSSASWVNVVTWTSNDTGAQKWSFYGNAPYMFISPECNSGVLDVADAKYEDGTNICINVKTGHDAQLFNVVKVNPPSVGEMTYPTIMFDTDSYTVGDTVNFSWAKTSANTDFYQYWVVVHNATTGKSYYSGATGDSGDVTKNTLSFVADAEGEYTITVYAVPHNNKEERQKWDTKSITVLTHSHSYIATITKKATCSEFGIKTYTCTCGKSYTETLSKSNNHSNLECVSRSGKFASVWTYKCSDCGDEYTYDFGVKNATATVISNNEVAVNIEFFNDDVEPRNHYVEYMAVSNANPEGIMSLYGGQKTYEEFSDKHYYAVFFYFEESLKEKIGDKHCIFIGVQNKTNPKNYSGMVKVEYDWPQGKYFYLKSGETLDLNEALFSDKSSGVLGYSLKKYDTNVIDYKDGVCTAKKTGRAYMVFINNKTGEIRGGTIVVQCEKHNLLETETVSPTCTKNGIKMYDCKNCDYTYTETIAKSEHDINYLVKIEPSCSEQGIVICECKQCDFYEERYIDATEHFDRDEDGTCDACYSPVCDCMCHKTGIVNIIWKLLRFFYKLFGANKICVCGVEHY